MTPASLTYGPYAKELWDGATDLIAKIADHPFCMGLAQGHLPIIGFRHYVSQDMLYIIEDARALAFTGARSKELEEMYFFLDMAKDGLDIERLLHGEFTLHFEIPTASSPSPACSAYTSFLLEKARNDAYEVSVAALLPCFWVYHHINQHIRQQSITPNVYQKWLDTYSDESFVEYVNRFIAIANHQMECAPSDLQKRMINAFRQSTQFEYDFFDEAWRIGEDSATSNA